MTEPDRPASLRRLFVPMTRGAKQAAVFLAVLMVLLTAGNYLLAASAVRRAVVNAASVQQLCATENGTRMRQVNLWMHLIAISPPPPAGETPAARDQRIKATRELIAYIHQAFAPRNCQKGT
jgi:hypothetical protein